MRTRYLKFIRSFTTTQILVIGYIFVMLLGAWLLSLPISSSRGIRQPFVDALFVAASGISTTGLTPVVIGSFYSRFGQIVLMILVQIGGISYMTFFVFIASIFGLKLGLLPKIVANESMAGGEVGVIYKFFMVVVLFTFLFEFIGAAILALVWMKEYPISYAVYLGVFHSISAFCTAGFAIFPNSLVAYRSNLTINMTINFISIVGGLGFFVLYNLYISAKEKCICSGHGRLSLHTKLVLIVTFVLLFGGTIIMFFAEQWPAIFTLKDKLLVSSFQVISASTTDGFNSIAIGSMSTTSLFLITMLMIIGASPGSTGGGIKTTTVGVIFLYVWAQFNERSDVELFGRKIPDSVIKNTLTIFACFVIVVVVDLLLLTATEKAPFLQILFEVGSAIGDTGLSMGITSKLTDFGKILISITMFIGRVGPLAIGFFFAGKPKKKAIRYAEEEVML